VPVLKSFADGRVFGGTWGAGPATVLALHGWRRTHQDFSPVFDPVDGDGNGDDDGHREAAAPPGAGVGPGVVAPDLFGFGATPPPPEAWGSADYARALVALFEEPGVLADRVVVVGHSFGGRVAVHLAPLVPDRIERLVLTGVPLLDRQGRAARPAAAYRVGRRLHRLGLLGDERLEAMKAKYGSADYRAAQGVMRDVLVRILAEQYGDEMAAIGAPVDLVWGEHDTEAPLEAAERAQGLFPSARLLVLPGVGHLTPTEAPDQLRRVVVGGPVPEPGWR
jgi:pimeloyl-ACP methyl ester carboxylesterase